MGDPQARNCNLVSGAGSKTLDADKKTQVELLAALKESFAICDVVFAALTDAQANDMVKMHGLFDEATLADASAEWAAISAEIARTHPPTNQGIAAITQTYRDHFFLSRGGSKGVLFSVAGCAVLLVLLIACANVANLMLVRSANRERELRIRISLGATRARIVQQLLVETMVLAVLGGLIGTT